MNLPISQRTILSLLLSLFLCSIPVNAHAREGKSEGADLVIGGTGTAPGEFTVLRDLAFDGANNLYTLESGGTAKDSKGTYQGVARVQEFDNNGKFLRQFPLNTAAEPQRLAVTKNGEVFVTFPAQDMVRHYAPSGEKVRDYAIANAFAITAQPFNEHECIAVSGEDKISFIALDTHQISTQNLPGPITKTIDMTADKNGHLWLLGGINQIFEIDEKGAIIRTIGSGDKARAEDGSAALHSVAVDGQGNIYSLTYGNPGLITMYNADGQRIVQRGGQFKWADVWSTNSSYVPLAVDGNNRLWAAATELINHPLYDRFHFRPAIVRTEANFFEPKNPGVRTSSALLLGFKATIETPLPYNIAYQSGPISATFVVAPANRNLQTAHLDYHVYDATKTLIAQGQGDLRLQDGVEARFPMNFQAPRYGWYALEVQISSGAQNLMGLSEFFGVTPRYANLPALKAGESPGGWEDAPRQMFSGLPAMRLHPTKGLDKFDSDLKAAQQSGATVIVQLTDKKDEFTPEKIAPIITRFKGRVNWYELFNEPNFSWSAQEFTERAKAIITVIRSIDPNAKIMGPSFVNLDLDGVKAWYEGGAGQMTDALALHDYEGHESISPEHWRWKFAQLREIMAKYGDADKPIWQTERAIAGVRGGLFMGTTQAIRLSLHADLLQTLNVPIEHNLHYYLNQGGYSDVPSYVWSSTGPHPAALVMRTRAAQTRGRNYAGTLDFGTVGNTLFMGLRYQNNTGSTLILRNLGLSPQEVAFKVTGSNRLELIDAWGNVGQVLAVNDMAKIPLGQLPTYVQLAPGQNLQAVPMNWPRNVARAATLTYDGKGLGDIQWLNNGVIETIHDKNPLGGTDGKRIWQGDEMQDNKPQTIEMRWNAPQKINAVILRGVRADNSFSALLDYDLQVLAGDNNWKTIDKVRSNLPPSDHAQSADANALTWYQDTNLWLYQFAPIETRALRLVIYRTTYGFAPDEIARATVQKTWGNSSPSRPMLREIEVY